MAFVVEQITAENQEKILHDMQNDQNKLRILNYALRDDAFPVRWAIDRENDYYLLQTPILVREERVGHLYYIYFQKQFYELETKSTFGNIIKLNELPTPDLLIGLQNTVRAAFNVYGYFGVNDSTDVLIKNAQVVTSFEDAK